MITKINRFIQRQDGASLMEYGLLLMLITLVCVAGANLLEKVISSLFTSLTFH